MFVRTKWLIGLVVAMAAISSPCWAWLYDGGVPQRLAQMIRENSSTTAVAAPFVLAQDSYATSFGGAFGRAFGPVGAHVNVSLTTWTTHPDATIGTWSIVPVDTNLLYYYAEPEAPILLRAGVPYSLVFAPQAGFAASMSYSVQGYYGYGTSDGESWQMLSWPLCARVAGYAVPEPGTASCMLSLLVGLIALPRVRRRGP